MDQKQRLRRELERTLDPVASTSCPELEPIVVREAVKSAPVTSTSVLCPDIEAIVVREVRALFQPNGSSREALTECLKWSLEDSVIPAFERCFKNMFDQIDESYRRRSGEHTRSVEKRIDVALERIDVALERIGVDFERIYVALAEILESKVTASEDSLEKGKSKAKEDDA